MISRIILGAVKVLERIGTKLILTSWKHIVRNSTAVIYDVVLHSRKKGSLSDQDAELIKVHLRRIEKSIGFVKPLDSGDNHYIH